MKKIILILLIISSVNISKIFAKKDIYSSPKITGNAWLNSNSLSSNVLNGITAGNGNNLNYKNISLKSYVKFFLNTESIPPSMTAFTAKINVNIDYYLDDTNPTTLYSETKILEINYDPTDGVKYKNVDIALYENAHTIRINHGPIQLSLNGNILPITNAHRDFISIQAFTEHDRVYNFMKIFANPSNNSFDINISKSYNSQNNELILTWSNVQTGSPEFINEGYELEYTFIDDYPDNPSQGSPFIPANQISFSFKNNSTRILLKENSYTIPLVQEHGYLVYRIVAYGLAGTDLDRMFFVPNSFNNGAIGPDEIYNLGTFQNSFPINVSNVHTNDKINWQSVTTFAEEGKSKTVVKYMDGRLLPRQTVTRTSTERNAIIAETIYDFQGRPAVNTLPTPVDFGAIKYYPDFNLNTNGQPYSYIDFNGKAKGTCEYNIEPLDTKNGAGKYYSKNNLNKTLFNAFIPEANGYAFNAVTFMPDPTERVVSQGNVGEVFQPGNTGLGGIVPYKRHDTQYFYGSAEQIKLDQLFGTDAGYASYYQKNLVIDPNGQGSVSYVNSSGKTVATALVGDSPKSLDPLTSNASATTIEIDLLKGENIVNNQDHSITNSKAFLVLADNTKYDFNYAVNKQTFQALTCANANYCLDCIYDLDISLVNDKCGEVVYSHKSTIGSLDSLDFKCNNLQSFKSLNFKVNLNVGSYTLTKKLTVNKYAAENYVSKLVNDSTNICLKKYSDFYNDAWATRDTTRCLSACDDCKADANRTISNRQKQVAINACDSLWCKPQMGTSCDISKQMMLNDLTPGGQYAVYKDDFGNFSPTFSPISIFSFVLNQNITTLFNLNNAINTNTIMVDIPGYGNKPLSFFLNANNPNLLQILINNWPDDLSEKLLPLHPEYCYLKFCYLPQIERSYSFDNDYMSANTLAEAQNIASNINIFYQSDPFYAYLSTLSNSQLQANFANEFNNFTGNNSGILITQFATFITNCPSSNTINTCAGQWADGIKDDEEWQKFQALYFSLKQKYWQMAREHYVINSTNCCPNDYIGCKDNNCFVPSRLSISPPVAYPCKSNITLALYKNATRRINNINDINMPGTEGLATSLYDLTNEQIGELVKNQTKNEGLCPSCPELDAFKGMVYFLQSGGYIKNGSTFKADAIAGIKDSLRVRLTGTALNSNISIDNVTDRAFTLQTGKCKVLFRSDTTINWGTAEILPTCLEITDYRNAKLHLMVNESYKTTVQIFSDCDLFYCDGVAPEPKPKTDECKCDAEYDSKKRYQLGDVAKFKDVCYIVKKIDSKRGLKIGVSPESTDYWVKVCEQKEICENPFELDFETPGGFDTLGDGSMIVNGSSIYNVNQGNHAQNYYAISNQTATISRTPNPPVFLQTLPSNAFLVKINAPPTTFFMKKAIVKPNKNYSISFDYGVWDMANQGTITFALKVNGQVISTITPTNAQLRSIQSVLLNWNSGNATNVVLEFVMTNYSVPNRKYISLDNIKMVCEQTPVCVNPFNLDFESPAIFTSSLGLSSTSPTSVNRYTIQQFYPINNTNLPSRAMIVRPNANNQMLIEKIAPIVPSTQYKISFDARVIIDRTMQLEVKINNQSINTYTITWLNPQTFTINWNSTSNNQIKISIHVVQVRQDKSDEIALDNIKMDCIRNSNNANAQNTATSTTQNTTTSTTQSRYIPKNACGCNSLCDLPLPLPNIANIPCDSILKNIATEKATIAFVAYKDSLYQSILNAYYKKCMQSLETFSTKYADKEYHYTLYYYDQSGNLVRTVPPAGVKPITNPNDLARVEAERNSNNGITVPTHILLTTYRQNSLNAVVWQKTPDAGISQFFYDALGRIAFSENAKQAPANRGSYTYYDDLGRTVEVGQISAVPASLAIKAIVSNYAAWKTYLSTQVKTEITKTFYDKPYLPKIDLAFGANGQQNLRNRIATVAYFANNTSLANNNYDHATHYSYDIAGNVIDLLQDFGTNSDFGTNPNNVITQSRKMSYQFDLISGKVNELHYQKGNPDQYLYRYQYNADNKLTEVYTSTNGIIWENDARYKYYRHGPLARTEYGSDNMQGVDMVYTLQGWIKGVNGYGTHSFQDLGRDGNSSNTVNVGYQAQNKAFAPDVFSYWLSYHQEDYTPIGNATPYIAGSLQPLVTGAYHTDPKDLFNGNIRSMYTWLSPFREALGMKYTYDQLNRLTTQSAYDVDNGVAMGNNWKMSLKYDPNGNIQKLLRNDKTPSMDRLNYFYYNSDNTTYSGDPISPLATNRLAYVTDAVGTTIEPSDIENQDPNNYRYDAIGNLISDAKENIAVIQWNIQNKITKVLKYNNNSVLVNINYSYDALGNRIKKVVFTGSTNPVKSTQYYVRDAQGNILAIYEIKNNALHWTEQSIYGSSRLSIYKPEVNLTKVQTETFSTRNTTQYELTNHLGNVLATISDSRTATNTATVLTSTDYYAFGMAMPDRKFALGNVKFRYGFNDKENDNETSTQDYGFRIYNPALGKFLSVDPIGYDYPWNSVYAFAENEPTSNIDLDGLERKKANFNDIAKCVVPGHYRHKSKSKLFNSRDMKIFVQSFNRKIHKLFRKEDVDRKEKGNSNRFREKYKKDSETPPISSKEDTKIVVDSKDGDAYVPSFFTSYADGDVFKDRNSVNFHSEVQAGKNLMDAVDTVLKSFENPDGAELEITIGGGKEIGDDIKKQRGESLKKALEDNGFRGKINVNITNDKVPAVQIMGVDGDKPKDAKKE